MCGYMALSIWAWRVGGCRCAPGGGRAKSVFGVGQSGPRDVTAEFDHELCDCGHIVLLKSGDAFN